MKTPLLTIAWCCLVLSGTYAQRRTCATDSLVIRTGYDENTQAAWPVGTADASWIITSDDDGNSQEPRPSYAIAKDVAWKDPMPNTQWISSYQEAGNIITGNYSFVFTFCLGPKFLAPVLHLNLRSDNKAYVYLNGHFIDSTLNGTSFKNPNPVVMSTNNVSYFVPGQNELKVVNHNEGLVKGINVSGYVRTENYGLFVASCCAQPNFISGLKWEDKDGNGIKESGETGLGGWKMQLSNGQTATTDQHGYYYFSNLPPGVYTVTEVQQPGWVATYPEADHYQIVLGTGEIKDGNNFGNRNNSCPEKIIVKIDSLCAGKPTLFTASYGSQQTATYTWNFGDGQSGTGANITHTYPGPGAYTLLITASAGSCTAVDSLPVLIVDCIPCKECIGSFAPIPGKKYVLSAWVKEANSTGKTSYTGPAILLTFEPPFSLPPIQASGLIIDGWQRIEQEFGVPGNATAIRIKLLNTGNQQVFFDDIRIDPFEAGTKSFVYDPATLRLMAELDERNYATFYEYDNEGALIRVKKETERGIKTIKESGNNTQIKH